MGSAQVIMAHCTESSIVTSRSHPLRGAPNTPGTMEINEGETGETCKQLGVKWPVCPPIVAVNYPVSEAHHWHWPCTHHVVGTQPAEARKGEVTQLHCKATIVFLGGIDPKMIISVPNLRLRCKCITHTQYIYILYYILYFIHMLYTPINRRWHQSQPILAIVFMQINAVCWALDSFDT